MDHNDSGRRNAKAQQSRPIIRTTYTNLHKEVTCASPDNRTWVRSVEGKVLAHQAMTSSAFEYLHIKAIVDLARAELKVQRKSLTTTLQLSIYS